MTDRIHTVALMAATLAAQGVSPTLAVRDALALYQEVERQVAVAYPAPKSKDLPKCTCHRTSPGPNRVVSTLEKDCPRHGIPYSAVVDRMTWAAKKIPGDLPPWVRILVWSRGATKEVLGA